MSTEDQVCEFIELISSQAHIENVTNQYSNPALLSNLKHYLMLLHSFPYSGHLLVGEAPGYKGCAMCGIPLTSQRIINESEHPFVIAFRPMVSVSGNQTERTATIVWNQLDGKSSVPAFWNVFPFHPHMPGALEQNRTPTAAEASVGMPYLDTIVGILKPHTIVA